ncbi:hypothetical protein Tco_0844436 [Tanacetum coccineum]
MYNCFPKHCADAQIICIKWVCDFAFGFYGQYAPSPSLNYTTDFQPKPPAADDLMRYLDSVRDKVSVCILDSVYWDKFVYKDNSTYTGCSVLFYKVCIGSVSFKVLMIGHGLGLFDTDGASVSELQFYQSVQEVVDLAIIIGSLEADLEEDQTDT